MAKKVVIISSSPRKGGNSELLARSFAEGAKKAGNVVEKIDVRTLKLNFCTGCLYCQSHDGCVQKDDMNALYAKISAADVLVFATPIYYYAVSGQLKTFLDRLNPLYIKQNAFRKVYLLASAADTDEAAMDGAVKDISGWIDCFDNVTLAGVIRGVGVEKAGEVVNTPAYAQAFEMGAGV